MTALLIRMRFFLEKCIGVTIDTEKKVSLRATEVILPPAVALIATEVILPLKTASLWESAKRDRLGALH